MKVLQIIETNKQFFIVMEYANNGDLFHYISQNSYLEEKEAMLFFVQIIDAVEYIHKLNICHRYLA